MLLTGSRESWRRCTLLLELTHQLRHDCCSQIQIAVLVLERLIHREPVTESTLLTSSKPPLETQ
jgi:hypothetical protein